MNDCDDCTLDLAAGCSEPVDSGIYASGEEINVSLHSLEIQLEELSILSKELLFSLSNGGLKDPIDVLMKSVNNRVTGEKS
jgi:hypothetical protein